MAETIKTKICRVCKQTKSLSEFYKNTTYKDGYFSRCKICEANYQKEYRKTEGNKIAQKRYEKSQKCKNARNIHSEKRKAGNAVTHAIRDGKLISPKYLLCYYCPKPANQYHHWHGYEPENWLDIIPICRKCHNLCHKKVAC